MNFMKKHKGFTLIEVLIVVAIVAVLASFGVSQYRDYVIRSYVAEPIALVSLYSKEVVAQRVTYGDSFISTIQYQPYISSDMGVLPDGSTDICFIRGSGVNSTAATGPNNIIVTSHEDYCSYNYIFVPKSEEGSGFAIVSGEDKLRYKYISFRVDKLTGKVAVSPTGEDGFYSQDDVLDMKYIPNSIK